MGKGKTVRQIHHFTDGLWSSDMDSRADLQSSVNSCRKLENLQVDQYGEAIRRPGFQYIGGSLGECLAIDPLLSFPDYASLSGIETFTSVDQYGSMGFYELRKITYPADWWLVCDWLVYCNGPSVEGVGMQDYHDKFITRWRAKLEDGWIYYGKVGEPWEQVSTALYPSQLVEPNGLGFCFDVDGLPVFCTQIGTDIQLRRFVAGTPTTYTFSGVGPKLYLNANVQWNNTLWDVVCYYCESGDLKERFQRDNFNTAYTLYHSGANYLTRVKNVDVSPSEDNFVYLAATGSASLRVIFRSSPYAIWPMSDHSFTSISIRTDGDYIPVIVSTSGSDDAEIGVSVIDDGDYMDVILVSSGNTDAISSQIAIQPDGYYDEVVVPDSESDSVAHVVSIATDGDYVIGAIDGGSYSESATQTVSIQTDGDYTV